MEREPIISPHVEKTGGTKLSDHSMDFVFLINTLYQIEDMENFGREVVRILKHKGKLVVVDWKEGRKIGSHHVKEISEESMIESFKNQNLSFLREIDAGEHHYGIIFSRK